MERVTGWYRRSTQWVLLGIAVVLVSALNIDALTIADYLYRNDAARAAVVAAAQRAPGDMSYEQANEALAQLKLPIGWEMREEGERSSASLEAAKQGAASETQKLTNTEQRAGNDVKSKEARPWGRYFQHALGLLVTALAAMLGAPFWFDVLSRVSTLRTTQKSQPQSESSRNTLSLSLAPSSAVVPGRAANDQQLSIGSSGVGHMKTRQDGNDEADACGNFAGEEATTDESLPAARGGVAP